MTTAPLYQLSPSKLGTWLDCPRRFMLQYVERQRGAGAWAHLSMGNAIHATLRAWFDEPESPRTRARLDSVIRSSWQSTGFRDDAQSAQWRDAAGAMVWAYLRGLEPGFRPHSLERSLGARTAGLVLNGRIDRLDEQGPSTAAGGVGAPLTVVDYKTGKRVPTHDDVRGSFALAIYAVCVQQTLRRPCTRVALHHVPSGVRVEHEYTEGTLERQIHRVEQIGAEMQEAQARLASGGDPDELFAPQPGPLCSWCDVRDLCPVGAEQGPKRAPWAGLPHAEESFDGPG